MRPSTLYSSRSKARTTLLLSLEQEEERDKALAQRERERDLELSLADQGSRKKETRKFYDDQERKSEATKRKPKEESKSARTTEVDELHFFLFRSRFFSLSREAARGTHSERACERERIVLLLLVLCGRCRSSSCSCSFPLRSSISFDGAEFRSTSTTFSSAALETLPLALSLLSLWPARPPRRGATSRASQGACLTAS